MPTYTEDDINAGRVPPELLEMFRNQSPAFNQTDLSTVRLCHLQFWIVDLWDRSSNVGPGGGLDTTDRKSHAWITPENLDAENWKGLTYLNDPANDNPVETNGLFHDDTVSSRTGEFALGEFIFKREKGSEDVSIALADEDATKFKIGKCTFEDVTGFNGTGRVNEADNKARKKIEPGWGSARFIWPAMKCEFRFQTPVDFMPEGEESAP